MKEIKEINLFISCPGDIQDELNSIEVIVKEINKTIGKISNFVIQIVHWNEDTYTDIGEDGQEIINDQIEYDILIGILWMRLGTPTKRDKSGTVEEINRAIENKEKQQLIYFKTATPINLNSINTSELNQVMEFKKELSNKILYKEFESIEKFETLFRLNLSSLIKDKFIDEKKSVQNPTKIDSSDNNGKYQNIVSLIDEIENATKDGFEDIDIFNINENGHISFEKATRNLNNLTGYLNKLTDNLKKGTAEINQANNIKDTRLKLSKAKKVVNRLSKELDEFNDEINSELPNFSENLKEVGKTTSDLLLASRSFNNSETNEIESNTLAYRDSMEYAMNATANMLKEVIKWPAINLKFNTSKRNTEVALKDLMKEMMFGLKLIDEALEIEN
ncbi:hypothetical protein SAMN04488096_1243 [Mesonia phycicola]|uniref:DUF4062 domain-containing protein n=1 Tax=Mesonia phycicola TaxID=579105 RepID=A0A1M6HV65_9FLAO|nr:hypothetical protein [Mesonia phycicola]SHJ26080.1 hypothetical protein SAMN04488096_1243 [Mesonia phycicola]